jgi:uncharacterized protein (TIGR03435 family)
MERIGIARPAGSGEPLAHVGQALACGGLLVRLGLIQSAVSLVGHIFSWARFRVLAPAAALAAGIMGACSVWAQTAPSPRFEVASIRPSPPSAPHPGRLGAVQVLTTPGRLTARNASLKELIEGAYGIEDYQISSGLKWIASPGFDVEAKSDGPAGRRGLLLMLQSLLADRFKLAIHRETRELLVWALVAGKKGPNFRRLTEKEASCWPLCEGSGKINHVRYRDLPSLAAYLTRLGSWPGSSARPVIDRTGLNGDFDIDLDMSKILETAAQESAPPTNASIYDATVTFIEDNLGLKLQPQKAPIAIFVIDRAEGPSGN